MLHKLKWAITLLEQPKIFVMQKDESVVDHNRVIRCFNKFSLGCETIRQGHVGLK